MTRGIARRVVLAAALALAGCAGSGTAMVSSADRQDIARIEAYLNAPATLRFRFLQIWPDGGQGSGILTYAPGSLAMDYERPQGMTLRARDGKLVLRDPETGAVTRMGLSHMPLGLLLEQPVRLRDAITVTAVRRGDHALQISLARTGRLPDGLLTLQFQDQGDRLQLAGIVIVDDRQHTTRLQVMEQLPS